ncbi:MAG: molybdopterin-binding protein [bacterium]|nr:molybdopterin-binding protein [bacterium]
MTISRVALAVIGDEVLLGEVADLNIHLVSREIFRAGAELGYVCVLPDDVRFLVEHLGWMRERYDWVITTGGIGATHDDLTKQVVSRIMGVPLVVAPEAVDALEARLGSPLSARLLELAMVPEGAELITNELTAAPGFVIGNLIVLPGIPKLVESMLGMIKGKFKGSEFFTKTVLTPLRESEIASHLEEVQARFPSVKVGSYPRIEPGGHRVRVVLRSRDPESLGEAEALLVERIGQ